LFATACNERSQQSVASSRYEAVKAVVEPASRWCDSSYTSEAPELTLPPLAASKVGVPSPLAKKRTWVNLWATWCQPCLREMPLLLKWRDELHKDGVEVDVLFLSLDEDVTAFDAFVSQHKELAKSKVVRAASQREYAQWATSLLKDASMPIPIRKRRRQASLRTQRFAPRGRLPRGQSSSSLAACTPSLRRRPQK
jgi:thiol-disulfide isomerase/thioredoxin